MLDLTNRSRAPRSEPVFSREWLVNIESSMEVENLLIKILVSPKKYICKVFIEHTVPHTFLHFPLYQGEGYIFITVKFEK